jgi:hypothetical protein
MSHMPDDAPKYTIRDDHDPDEEIPIDNDPLEAYQTYVEDRDAGHGDMGFTLEDFERYIAEIRRRRKRRLPKEQGYRLFQTVTPPDAEGSHKSPACLKLKKPHRPTIVWPTMT